MNSVLDACAMLAYLRNEPGGESVEALLSDPGVSCYAHSMNLCEVYYHKIRSSSVAIAERVLSDLAAAGVTERHDLDGILWRRAGWIKSRGGIALPDCLCIALAERLSAQVVTSDHREFDPLVPLNIVPILFIR